MTTFFLYAVALPLFWCFIAWNVYRPTFEWWRNPIAKKEELVMFYGSESDKHSKYIVLWRK